MFRESATALDMTQQPYRVNVSPEKAKELAESGGALLLLDIPAGTVVGIDQQVRKMSFFVTRCMAEENCLLLMTHRCFDGKRSGRYKASCCNCSPLTLTG